VNLSIRSCEPSSELLRIALSLAQPLADGRTDGLPRRGIVRAMPAYKSGDVISIRPPGFEPASAATEVLFRGNCLEISRIILRSGDHHAAYISAGPVVLQCIDGDVRVAMDDTSRELRMGELLYLPAGIRHSISGLSDSAVLFIGIQPLSAPSDAPAPRPDAVDEALLESFPASDPPAIFRATQA